MKIEFNDLEEFSAFCFDLEAKKDDWFQQGYENGMRSFSPVAVHNLEEELEAKRRKIEQLNKKIAELENKRKSELA